MMSRPYEEPEVTTDFTSQIAGKLKSPIATGSFGTVHRCTIESNIGETEVAVKVFRIDHRRKMDKLTNTAVRELMVWLKLKHSNVVPLLGTARIRKSPLLALVSEWMPSGKLSDYLKEPVTIITLAARIKLAEGIAEGLKYLHSKKVIHGDLHPGNVLIDGSGNPRLTDFGLATVAEDKQLQLTTSTAMRDFNTRWRAPEVVGTDSDVDPERPTFKSDIYSFGSVMFFIVSGDVPWKEKCSSQICIALSQRKTPTRPDNIIDYHWDLIQQCWSWTPGARPEATVVLQVIGNRREGTSSAAYNAWSMAALPLRRRAGPERQDTVADFRAGIPTKHIALFVENGSGKSSVVYLLFFFKKGP